MSIQTVDKPSPVTPARPAPFVGPPPLTAGDHLSRAEFERRYQAHPEIKKAEPIEGVVYTPSPTRFEQHGQPHARIITGTHVLSLTAGHRPAFLA